MPSLRIVESARANGDPASPRRPRRYQTNLIPFPDTVGRTSRSAFFPAAPQPMRDNTREPFAAADRKNHEEETK